MAGGKPAGDFNEFEKYYMQVIIPLSIETEKTELRITYEKYQDKYKLILNNSLSDVKWNLILDIIKESESSIMGQLYNVTWMHYNPLPFLEYNNSTEALKKGER